MYAISENGYRGITSSDALLAGETMATKVPEVLLKKIQALEARLGRDQILRETDWTQMADAPLTAAQKTAMGMYRQALRDLPSLPGFPDITWPTLPQLNGAAGDIKAPM